jgi:hypothetical protein
MIPKILFHGTTVYRWANIKNDKKMRVDLQKYFRSDEKKSAGYLYFTDDVQDAVIYGIGTALIDMNSLAHPIARQLANEGKDIIILAFKTSGVRDRVEHDPETFNHKATFQEMARSYPQIEPYAKATWYRVKDDISIQHVFAYRITPFDQIDPWMLEIMAAGILITDLRDEIILSNQSNNTKE